MRYFDSFFYFIWGLIALRSCVIPYTRVPSFPKTEEKKINRIWEENGIQGISRKNQIFDDKKFKYGKYSKKKAEKESKNQ